MHYRAYPIFRIIWRSGTYPIEGFATMATSTKYDCIVIGSGQGGTPLANAFAKAGKKTALIERAHIGGCCVNEGLYKAISRFTLP